jgi:uncharacterized protein (DUF1330 family)
MTTTEPTDKQLREMAQQDLGAPFEMVNLLKFREWAEYGEDVAQHQAKSGREAYDEYARAVLPIILALGGRLVYRGQCNHLFVGSESQDYDELIIVSYPSRKAYLEMFNSSAYQSAIKHRIAGLEFRVLHQCSPLI